MKRVLLTAALWAATSFVATDNSLSGMTVAASDSPVSVTMLTPVNGSTVSGVIELTATASSTAGPITHVDFYRDGVFIGRAYNYLPAPPSGVKVFKLLYKEPPRTIAPGIRL